MTAFESLFCIRFFSLFAPPAMVMDKKQLDDAETSAKVDTLFP